MIAPDDSKVGLPDLVILCAFVLVLVIACHVLAPYKAAARDIDGRYANSPLKGWFESLHSGRALAVPTQMGPRCRCRLGNKRRHYRVASRQWWDVPDEP